MRKAFKIAAEITALGLAGGVAAGCGNANAPAPSAVAHLEGDGYTLSRTIPHSEIAQEYSVGSMLNPAWTTDGATGTRGNSTEDVYSLTAQGTKALGNADTRQVLIGDTGYGDVGLEVHVDPGFLTISGPTSEMQPSSGPNVPVQPTTPAPAPAANVEPLGTTYTVVDETGSTYKVKVDKIAYGVAGDGVYFPDRGNQLVGLHLWAQAVTLDSSREASIMVTALTVLGSNGEGYSVGSTMASTGGTTINSTLEFVGQHTDGWAAVEMPKGVTVVAIKFAPNWTAGAGGPYTWNVSGK